MYLVEGGEAKNFDTHSICLEDGLLNLPVDSFCCKWQEILAMSQNIKTKEITNVLVLYFKNEIFFL